MEREVLQHYSHAIAQRLDYLSRQLCPIASTHSPTASAQRCAHALRVPRFRPQSLRRSSAHACYVIVPIVIMMSFPADEVQFASALVRLLGRVSEFCRKGSVGAEGARRVKSAWAFKSPCQARAQLIVKNTFFDVAAGGLAFASASACLVFQSCGWQPERFLRGRCLQPVEVADTRFTRVFQGGVRNDLPRGVEGTMSVIRSIDAFV